MFSGAGVLIFNGDNILLYRERKSKAYTEPGGKFDKKHKTLEDVAIDELYEETCCLFDIVDLHRKNNYVDIEYDNGRLYRLYVINLICNIDNLKFKYEQNLNRLISSRAKKYYLETNKLAFVSLDEALKGEKYIRDIYNRKIKIRYRLLLCLQALFDDINNISPLNVSVKKVVKNRGIETYLLDESS